MRGPEWRQLRREGELRHARQQVLELPFPQRSYWLRRLDAEGFAAIPAFSAWLARGENDVPTT